VLRATPLYTVASIVVVAACSDRPEPTAPARANAIVTANAIQLPYTVPVDGPVTLEGFDGSAYDIAHGISALGEVAGVSSLGGVIHAVRWPAGSTALKDVGIGTPYDINTTGQLAGDAGLHAVLWTPDGLGGYTVTRIGEQIPSAISSSAYGINANGQVVGTYRVVSADGVSDKCFMWTPNLPNSPSGIVTTLADLGGSFCVANDINSSGYVVGAATTTEGETHGFVWSPPSWGRPGRIRDLTPGAGPSYATAINEARQIAGQHTTDATSNAAIWTPTAGGSYVVADLGAFTGTESFALDINDAGFVVGFARRSDLSEDDAFFWQNGKFTLLPGTASINLAAALSDFDGKSVRVVGTSLDASTGTRTAVRWDVMLSQPK